jgi:phage/plasmid-like protein (TIGR03299 family)
MHSTSACINRKKKGITMSHEVETMAYANETPWHGLGTPVADTLTPVEMLQSAGLDWKVEKKALFVDDLDTQINSHYALVRNTDSRILGICGNEYSPTQNEEVFDFFSKFCKAGDMKMETAGSLHGGKRVWGLAKINGGFMLGGKDEVEGYILLDNPHIWGRSLQIMFTPIRVVCNNTLTQALRGNTHKDATFRMSHDRAFSDEIKQEAAEKVGLAMKALDVFKDRAEFLSKKRAKDQKVMEFFSKLVNPDLFQTAQEQSEDGLVNRSDLGRTVNRLLDIVHTQPGADLKTSAGTWWGAFNAVTYYYDHVAGTDQDKRLTSAWFGSAATRKRQALDLAVEFAEAA